MSKLKKRSECPLSCSLDIWGDKWSLLIIRDLMFYNKSTYGDFLKSQEGIATNILSARLSALEENGIIEKVENPGTRSRVFYKLTQKGIELFPILVEVHLWAEKYLTIPQEIKPIIKEAKRDKEGFIRSSMKALKKV
ncbi:MAG: helix-turn-helix transcriptional regulator [Chitinophagales bacterium]|nr:helix-turn-helix transcriptional regulator [Chitinophagales bacterium]